MGEEHTQTQQEPSWWALEAGEVPGAAPAFDSPVRWPDAMAWEALFADEPAPPPPVEIPHDLGASVAPGSVAVEDPSLDVDAHWEAAFGDVDDEATELHLEPLPDSIWAPDPAADDGGTGGPPTQASTIGALGGFGGTTVTRTFPTPVAPRPAPPERPTSTPLSWAKRFDIRHGNAAIIALVSCVSLVLLGMFLSVRARDDLPTQTTRFDPPSTVPVSAPSPTASVPLTTTPTTLAPAPGSVSLSDLIPPDAVAPSDSRGAVSGGTGSSGSGGSSATTVPARTSPAPGSSSAAAQPAAQPTTNTTAAPEPETTAPSTTAPAAEDTTAPSTTKKPPPSFTIPTYTVPSIPGMTTPTSRPISFPGFSNN